MGKVREGGFLGEEGAKEREIGEGMVFVFYIVCVGKIVEEVGLDFALDEFLHFMVIVYGCVFGEEFKGR